MLEFTNKRLGCLASDIPLGTYPKLSHVSVTNPGLVSLRSQCPAIYNQGSIGSCTAQAGAGLAEFLFMKLVVSPPATPWNRTPWIMTHTNASHSIVALLTDKAYPADVQISAKVRVNSWIDGDENYRAGLSLVGDSANGDTYSLIFHKDHNTIQFLNENVVWGSPISFPWQTGKWYWFKLKMQAGVLYGKVWADDGTKEPSTWLFTQSGWSNRISGCPGLYGGMNTDVSFSHVSVRTPTNTLLFSDEFLGTTMNSAWKFIGTVTGSIIEIPSRLAIYYWERVLRGTVSYDSGASMQDCVNVMSNNGSADETLWPYNTSQFTVKPPDNVVIDAAKHLILSPTQLNGSSIDELRTCIANGFPFIFGFTVYSSWYNSSGTFMVYPPSGSVVGGHAVMAVGYDDATQYFTIRNSWGSGWGDGGYFYMPYQFITNSRYCGPFFTANTVKYTF